MVVHGRSRIGLFPPRKVGVSGAGGFISSEGSVAGMVSLGLGVSVTVEVMATGGGGDKAGGAFGIAFPQGGHGLGAGNALLARKVDNLCNPRIRFIRIFIFVCWGRCWCRSTVCGAMKCRGHGSRNFFRSGPLWWW